MNEIEKIKKVLLFTKSELPHRGRNSKEKNIMAAGYISALRDVLGLFGENPYFEISEEAEKLRTSGGKANE